MGKNQDNLFHVYFFSSVLFFLPIYLLFGFFPSIVNFSLYKTPNPEFFPLFNNYWSLGNTGIESFLLTFLSLLYVVLIFYFNNFILKTKIRNYGKKGSYIFSLFLGTFILIWFYNNLDTYGFYWQFKKYDFYNLNSWIFCIFYLLLFNISISTKSLKKNYLVFFALFSFCSLIPVGFIQQYDFEFFAIPALGILSQTQLNEIYFQYDLLIPILIALWKLVGFEIYNFYIFLNIVLFLYLLGLFKLLKSLISSRYILSLGIFSIIFLRYCLIDMKFGSTFIQYSPLRADLWIILALFASTWGLKSNKIFLALIVMLVFSFNNGVLYLIAYFLTLLVFEVLDSKRINTSIFVKWIKANISKFIIGFVVVLLVYTFIYSLGENIGTKQFLKYSIQSNKIQKFSIIWISLLSIGFFSGFISQRFETIERRKLETYVFLIFLTIINFTFCFYKNTILSFISVSTSYLVLLFIFFDLNSEVLKKIVRNFKYSNALKMIPIIVLLFPLAFNQYGIPTIIKNQFRFIKSNSAFKAKKINTDINQIVKLKKILAQKTRVTFYGPGTYIQYYELELKPDNFFNFTSNIYDDRNYRDFLKTKIDNGFLLVFPKSKVTPWGHPRKEYFDFWYSFLKENPSFSLYTEDKFEIIYRKTFHTFH